MKRKTTNEEETLLMQPEKPGRCNARIERSFDGELRLAVEHGNTSYCRPLSWYIAAPDLMDALLELLADEYLADPINADRMAKARQAIAKATGGVK